MLTETEPPTKTMYGLDLAHLHTYVAGMELGLHVGPITIGALEVSDLGSLASVCIPFP